VSECWLYNFLSIPWQLPSDQSIHQFHSCFILFDIHPFLGPMAISFVQSLAKICYIFLLRWWPCLTDPQKHRASYHGTRVIVHLIKHSLYRATGILIRRYSKYPKNGFTLLSAVINPFKYFQQTLEAHHTFSKIIKKKFVVIFTNPCACYFLPNITSNFLK